MKYSKRTGHQGPAVFSVANEHHDRPVFLASYKATRKGWQGMANRFIRWAIKSQYSHSEICAGNPFEAAVPCLSSVGNEGGVRIKVMRLNPDKWDLIRLHDCKESDLWAFYDSHRGQPYDWIGCVRSVLPFFGREHPTAWFCSEVCADVRGYPEAWRMHPGVLHVVESK